MLYYIDLLGTAVFAISGALTASEKKLDFFGISSVAFITALGGGTLRDVLLGSTPVGWMKEINYLLMIVVGISVALLFRKYVQKLRKTFFLFDTIGIAVFTILGLQKALNAGVSPAICIMMGMISAVFGGVIRDVVCNEIPLIFRKDFYAVTCLLGGCFYFLLKEFNLTPEINIILACSSIVVIRIFAVRYKWRLSSF
ncbi:trimeric intracellular cation channel family protein [Cryomorphaceae bacterium 1068]|nr:trimeric intracellular cation channel family protein [Cryomorphaceae bacterium 1068]